jgi:hypothetical protein
VQFGKRTTSAAAVATSVFISKENPKLRVQGCGHITDKYEENEYTTFRRTMLCTVRSSNVLASLMPIQETSVIIILPDSSIGYEGNILANNKKRTSFYR